LEPDTQLKADTISNRSPGQNAFGVFGAGEKPYKGSIQHDKLRFDTGKPIKVIFFIFLVLLIYNSIWAKERKS
jgi:hypothetical protein